MQHERTKQTITVTLAILFLLSMAAPVVAGPPQDVITVDSTVKDFNIHPYLEILEDPDSRLDEAVILADRLRTVIEKSPAKYQGREIYYTISAGVAEYNSSITNLDQLIKKQMMHCMKQKIKEEIGSLDK